MISSDQSKFYLILGSLIREARTKAKLKQETFATFLNLSRASIVNIEKGRQHPPIHLLWDIAKVLNIPVSDLFPHFEVEEKVTSHWKKIIAKESSNKETNDKIRSFIEEILSKKV